MDPTTSEAISHAFSNALFEGFWMALKLMWPLIIFVVLLKLFERWANRKIDAWKWRRKNKKFRGFSK